MENKILLQGVSAEKMLRTTAQGYFYFRNTIERYPKEPLTVLDVIMLNKIILIIW